MPLLTLLANNLLVPSGPPPAVNAPGANNRWPKQYFEARPATATWGVDTGPRPDVVEEFDRRARRDAKRRKKLDAEARSVAEDAYVALWHEGAITDAELTALLAFDRDP